ncbi:hypothetical protein DPMN_122365 [Dreissena polymorpha]|uniref:Uncharacterized protein n=1 Tax=Dreissena polymorpha TaxID=45954 RepID=A0A9D4GSB6_DREPO|nr:hypothetical protein DPMN_117583 [Dreissena polymorpha]KAH3820619.1 hypothetical protein DPMN_122365 [Dreissena polymorpha]
MLASYFDHHMTKISAIDLMDDGWNCLPIQIYWNNSFLQLWTRQCNKAQRLSVLKKQAERPHFLYL